MTPFTQTYEQIWILAGSHIETVGNAITFIALTVALFVYILLPVIWWAAAWWLVYRLAKEFKVKRCPCDRT